MTITTKSGDMGISYWKDRGVHKDDILIETIGALDEVQTILSVVSCQMSDVRLENTVTDLWGVMGELSFGKKYEKLEERVTEMEKVIDSLEDGLPKLEKFLIFKKEKATKLNWIRTEVRKAERRMVALAKKESVNPKLLAYINRLSDYLFMLAREAEEE
jgi:cob(I)alamin adenosyltransferase